MGKESGIDMAWGAKAAHRADIALVLNQSIRIVICFCKYAVNDQLAEPKARVRKDFSEFLSIESAISIPIRLPEALCI